MPTVEQVREVLKTVFDPELPVNLVDLGLIYDIKAESDSVHITMSLTTPGCGMARQIALSAKQAVIDQTKTANVLVTVTFDPPWDRSKMTPEGLKALGLPVPE